ncbi:MAG TPA: 3-dehydroquinate dehydratase, partial [Rhodobacter sp.]|nr:3-dehydroquinate dehydratase [Rhodobacter sp.]
ALEQAVGLVMISLAQQKSDMLIINKFGKQEVDGRGFRPAIAM